MAGDTCPGSRVLEGRQGDHRAVTPFTLLMTTESHRCWPAPRVPWQPYATDWLERLHERRVHLYEGIEHCTHVAPMSVGR